MYNLNVRQEYYKTVDFPYLESKMAKSKIEWTEQTWNPVVGCTKVSAGCKNCYAETMHKRLNAMGTRGYEKPFNQVICYIDRLYIPFKRKKPTTYFVNSMSDLFHNDVPFDFIINVFMVIGQTPQHTYQILTKNDEKMWRFFFQCGQSRLYNNFHNDNIWLGVSVENKIDGIPRIKGLTNILNWNSFKPRLFLSIEPLLEDLGEIDLQGISWVIVGGESGKNARPMKKEWVLNIKKQCDELNIPFFFKQWGTYGEDGIKRSKKSNGCLIDGIEYKNFTNL